MFHLICLLCFNVPSSDLTLFARFSKNECTNLHAVVRVPLSVPCCQVVIGQEVVQDYELNTEGASDHQVILGPPVSFRIMEH